MKICFELLTIVKRTRYLNIALLSFRPAWRRSLFAFIRIGKVTSIELLFFFRWVLKAKEPVLDSRVKRVLKLESHLPFGYKELLEQLCKRAQEQLSSMHPGCKVELKIAKFDQDKHVRVSVYVNGEEWHADCDTIEGVPDDLQHHVVQNTCKELLLAVFEESLKPAIIG